MKIESSVREIVCPREAAAQEIWAQEIWSAATVVRPAACRAAARGRVGARGGAGSVAGAAWGRVGLGVAPRRPFGAVVVDQGGAGEFSGIARVAIAGAVARLLLLFRCPVAPSARHPVAIPTS